MTPLHAALLIGAGIVAGFVNTLGGGGSLITVPALMLLGIAPDIANGTSRISILAQSVAGSIGFRRAGRLDGADVIRTSPVAVIGALAGAWAATQVPNWVLKPVLIATMVIIAAIMARGPRRSQLVAPAATSNQRVAAKSGDTAGMTASNTQSSQSPPAWAWIALAAAGAYGGFLQAGVGFVLLAVLTSGLRYDLVRANALKVVIVAIFTAVTLPIFVVTGKVLWGPGLLLAIGMVVGARSAVGFAVKTNDASVRRVVFATVVVSCVATLLK